MRPRRQSCLRARACLFIHSPSHPVAPQRAQSRAILPTTPAHPGSARAHSTRAHADNGSGMPEAELSLPARCVHAVMDSGQHIGGVRTSVGHSLGLEGGGNGQYVWASHLWALGCRTHWDVMGGGSARHLHAGWDCEGGTSSCYGCRRCVRAVLGDRQGVEPPHSLEWEGRTNIRCRACVQRNRRRVGLSAVALIGM